MIIDFSPHDNCVRPPGGIWDGTDNTIDLFGLVACRTTTVFSFIFFYGFLKCLFFVNDYQELQLDGFVTHELQFEDINKAFDLLLEGQCLRCVIWLNK